MKVIAVTGLMGSGKSEVLELLQKKNYCVLKSDELAKSFLKPGSPCFENLKTLFGKSALTKEGWFCPQILAEDVFSKHPEKLKKLENILHPLVQKKLSDFLVNKKIEGIDLVFYEIPLLPNQSLFENRFDCIILLIRPKFAIIKTLIKKGWQEKDILERLKKQGNPRDLRKKANFILKNTGNLQDLSFQLESILKTPFFSG